MQSTISLKLLLPIVSILGMLGFVSSSLTILFLNLHSQTLTSSTDNQPPQNLINSMSASSQIVAFPEQTRSGLPIRLKIPKINVDTSLEYVGLTGQKAVDVPKAPTNAAWFDLGPRPGDNGSAVITGHYGPWKNGADSVFDDLHELRRGDSLSVEDEKGLIITFVVRELRRYSQDEIAPEVFSASDGKAHLNLITCEGIWDKAQKSYSDRLVVFADKE